MAGLITLSLMAAQIGGAQLPAPVPAGAHGAVSASARATVRILPGAKIILGEEAEAQGYRLNRATITAEDGRQLSAKLVEFQ